jgi:Na+/melibiose symporter-like transporter
VLTAVVALFYILDAKMERKIGDELKERRALAGEE